MTVTVTNIVLHQRVILPLSILCRGSKDGEDPLSNVSAGTGLPTTAEIA